MAQEYPEVGESPIRRSSRDDFSAKDVRTLAARAGQMCSKCRVPTSGPHSDPKQFVSIGEAAHICAAAPGGPRYDSSQTSAQRSHITNGIWLCANCSDKVDKDWVVIPAEELHRWKREHEEWVKGEGMIPRLPAASLATREGLRLPPQMEMTAEMVDEIREQELTFQNLNRVELRNLILRLRLPEAVRFCRVVSKNAGTDVSLQADYDVWTVEGVQPGAKLTQPPAWPWPNIRLEIPRVAAEESIIISCYTVGRPTAVLRWPEGTEPDLNSNLGVVNLGNKLWWYMEGSYQFFLRGEFFTATLFVPLRLGFEDRRLHSLPCQRTREGWEVIPSERFPGMHMQA